MNARVAVILVIFSVCVLTGAHALVKTTPDDTVRHDDACTDKSTVRLASYLGDDECINAFILGQRFRKGFFVTDKDRLVEIADDIVLEGDAAFDGACDDGYRVIHDENGAMIDENHNANSEKMRDAMAIDAAFAYTLFFSLPLIVALCMFYGASRVSFSNVLRHAVFPPERVTCKQLLYLMLNFVIGVATLFATANMYVPIARAEELAGEVELSYEGGLSGFMFYGTMSDMRHISRDIIPPMMPKRALMLMFVAILFAIVALHVVVYMLLILIEFVTVTRLSISDFAHGTRRTEFGEWYNRTPTPAPEKSE